MAQRGCLGGTPAVLREGLPGRQQPLRLQGLALRALGLAALQVAAEGPMHLLHQSLGAWRHAQAHLPSRVAAGLGVPVQLRREVAPGGQQLARLHIGCGQQALEFASVEVGQSFVALQLQVAQQAFGQRFRGIDLQFEGGTVLCPARTQAQQQTQKALHRSAGARPDVGSEK